MGNIDESRISGILAGIGNMKKELEALEIEIKSLMDVSSEGEDLPEDAAEETSQEPIDISISDIDVPVPPQVRAPEPEATEPELAAEPAEEQAAEPVPETKPEEPEAEPAAEPVAEAEATEPAAEPVAEPEAEPTLEAELEPELIKEQPAEAMGTGTFNIPEEEPLYASHKASGKTVMDSKKADKAVMDIMAEKQAWRTDRPGSVIKNIISAISLNDRVLLINVLFKEDPGLFQDTIAHFNQMGSLEEALSYIQEHFPEWDLNSEPAYRLMMAVRRKLK